MAGNIGSVSITVDADATELPSQIEKETEGPLSRIGASMGKTLSAALGAAIDPSRVTAALRSGLTSSLSRLGSVGRAALSPLTKQTQNFADGFRDASAAASGAAGNLGRVGAAARTALNPAITAVQNFHSGFSSIDAALSSFSGRMGTVGGVARTAFNAASGAANAFAAVAGPVFSRVAAAASTAWDKIKSGAARAFAATGDAMKGALTTAGNVAGTAAAAAVGTALVKGFSRLEAIDTAEAKLAGLGVTGENLEKTMTAATNAVTGTAFGLGEAASAAASFSAAGVPIDGMERSLSILASTAAVGGSSLTEMGTIFGKVAATGKLNGEVLQQLAERGVPALSLVADQMGVTAEEASKMVSEGKVDFETFQSAMEAGLGPAAQAMGQSFSGMMANVGAALGRAGAEAQKPIFDSLKSVLPGVISLLNQITAAITPLATQIGTFLAPAMERLGAVLSGISFSTTAEGATSFLSALGPLLPVIGGMLGMLGPLLTNIPILGGLFSGLTGPVGLVAGALAALTAIPPDTLLAGFDSIISALPGIVTGLVEKLTEFLPAVVSRMAENIPIFVTGIIGIVEALIGAVSTALPGVIAAFVQLIPQVVTSLVGAIPTILTAALGLFNSIITALMTALPMIIQALLTMLPQLVTTLMGMLPTIIDSALNLFLGIVMGILTALPQIITAVLGMLPEIIGTLLGMIPQLIDGAVQLFTGIVEALPIILPALIDAVIGLGPVLVDTVISLVPQLLQAGVDLVGGLVEGLWEAAGSVGDALLKIAQDAIGGFLSFLGINSPSKLFMGYGENVGQGLVNGLTAMTGKVDGAMGNLASTVGAGFTGPNISAVAAPASSPIGGTAAATSSGSTATGAAAGPQIVQNYEITANNVDPVAVGASIADRSNFNLGRAA